MDGIEIEEKEKEGGRLSGEKQENEEVLRADRRGGRGKKEGCHLDCMKPWIDHRECRRGSEAVKKKDVLHVNITMRACAARCLAD